MKCYNPECRERATVICTCHFVDWCVTCIDSHYEAHRIAEHEQQKERIEQNEKLREIIVDFADLWDGKESGKYGIQLELILENLGIKDVPKFYSNINSYIAGKTKGKI